MPLPPGDAGRARVRPKRPYIITYRSTIEFIIVETHTTLGSDDNGITYDYR